VHCLNVIFGKNLSQIVAAIRLGKVDGKVATLLNKENQWAQKHLEDWPFAKR
jgi:hypothetical protein